MEMDTSETSFYDGKIQVATPRPANRWLLDSLMPRALSISAFILTTHFIFTSNRSENGEANEAKVKFTDFYVYRYMGACAILGIVITTFLLVQSLPYLSGLSISELSEMSLADTKEKRLSRRRRYNFELCNQILTIILVWGGAASFGFSSELSWLSADVLPKKVSKKFIDDAYFINCVYLVGFVFNFVSSLFVRKYFEEHMKEPN